MTDGDIPRTTHQCRTATHRNGTYVCMSITYAAYLVTMIDIVLAQQALMNYAFNPSPICTEEGHVTNAKGIQSRTSKCTVSDLIATAKSWRSVSCVWRRLSSPTAPPRDQKTLCTYVEIRTYYVVEPILHDR